MKSNEIIKSLEAKPNLTWPMVRSNLVFGGETLNSESEINLMFGCVTQKFNESSLVNVQQVNYAFYEDT